MPNITLIIIISAVIPIVLVVVIVGGLMRSQQQTGQLLATGLPARGRIMQLGTTGGSVAVMGHRHLKLILTVEVHPQAGPPYVASFTQLISELQLPSVQPGAFVELRVDPRNPSRIALASVGGPPPGPQAFGQPAPQGWGAPQQPHAFAPQPVAMGVAQPNYKSALPFIAFMMFITTVPTAAILLYVFGGFGGWFGSSQSADQESEEPADEEETPKKKKKDQPGGGVCARAAACCKVVSQGAGASACENWERTGGNEAGCTQALEGYKQAAKSLKKSCD